MDPRHLTVEALVGGCRGETAKYLRRDASDERYCFELFRRAVEERSNQAWSALIEQYRGIVLAWIRRHPAHAVAAEDDDYWVTRSFERFWHALGPDRFTRFSTLADLLTYLKTCSHCVLLDEARSRGARAEAPWSPIQDEASEPGHEDPELNQLSNRELWRIVLDEANDEAERVVIRLSFALDYKPNEIQSRHPTLFPSVADVYRIKRNVIERLRRSPRVLAYKNE